MPPPAPTTPPATLAQQHLDQVLLQLERTQSALLDAATGGDPDTFVGQCAGLSELLKQFQSVAKIQGGNGPAAASAQEESWKMGLVRLQAGLDALSAQAARLSAHHQRALDQLFPPDSLKAYSRLGGRSPGLGGRGYLKA